MNAGDIIFTVLASFIFSVFPGMLFWGPVFFIPELIYRAKTGKWGSFRKIEFVLLWGFTFVIGLAACLAMLSSPSS